MIISIRLSNIHPNPGSQTLQGKERYNNKELQSDFGLNMLDYGKRFYDGAKMQWTTPDPLAEKYYSISPYAYCANNPMRFIDPTGKYIVGANRGDRVSYSINKKTGDVKWHNASADVQRIGNAMLKTATGKERLDFMIGNDTKTHLRISSDNVTGNTNSANLGTTIPMVTSKDKNGKVSKVLEASITIYQKEIQKVLDAGASSGPGQEAGEKVKAYSGLTMDEAIGVVAGHESVHTEPENVEHARYDLDGAETKPEIIEYKIIDELKNER